MLSYNLLILNTLIFTIHPQQIDCIGKQTCKNDRLTCNNTESCSLTCDGSFDGQSCQKARLDASEASTVSVYCINYQDCVNTDITCGTGPCHIYCQAEQSCKKQKLICGSHNCIIECIGYQSCQDIKIDTTLATQFTCVGDQCPPNLIHKYTTTSATTTTTTSPTQPITTVHSTHETGSLTVATTVYTATNSILTFDDGNLSITDTDGIGKLLTWVNLIYLLLILAFFTCLLFCVYISCKMYHKSAGISNKDELEITAKDSKTLTLVCTGTAVQSETNDATTCTSTTDGMTPNYTDILKTVLTSRDVTEGEQNDESVVDNVSKINESYKIRHGLLNDSTTLNEGIESNTFVADTLHDTCNRSRIDTLENILSDVINENNNENSKNKSEYSYAHNGEEYEKSIVVKYHEQTQNIKLILYDFDQTITTIHLYKELKGKDVNAMELISDERLIEIFGGNERIERLQKHFSYLIGKNIKLGIVSFGFEKVIEKALYRMNMLQYFSFIVGRDSESMKKAFQQKVFYILHLMKNENYNKGDILFIDDDPKNIEPVVKVDCCKTMLVQPRIGVDEKHLKEIENNYVL